MSWRRISHRMVVVDQHGVEHVSEWRSPEVATLAVLPREIRLVDVHDSGDHHLATLVENGPSEPLLYVRSGAGIGPWYALVDGGLTGLFVVIRDGNRDMIRLLPEPTESVDVPCAVCYQTFTVTASALRHACGTGKRRRPPRIHVGP